MCPVKAEENGEANTQRRGNINEKPQRLGGAGPERSRTDAQSIRE